MLSDQDLHRVLTQAHDCAVGKFGDAALPAARLHVMVHAAVAIARYAGHSRYALAQRLGVHEDRIDRWMAPSESLTMPLPCFAACLLDPSVLGPEGHEWLRTRVAAATQDLGRRTPAADMPRQACELAEAAGQVAGLVVDVTCPTSDAGVEISPREQTHLDAAVAGVIDEACALRPVEVET